MRTTVTLDDDVATALDRIQAEQRVTFSQALNDVIREGPASRECRPEAWDQVGEWLDRPAAYIPVPGDRHRRALDEIVSRVRPTGNLVPDADLAALAIEHGMALATTDTGFARFPGLRTVDPTAD